MNKNTLLLLSVFLCTLLVIFVQDSIIFIIASILAIFDRCLLSRVKIIHGIEFSSISTIIVAMKYDLFVSLSFGIVVLYMIPASINLLIGDRWVINKEFKMIRGGFGIMVSVILILLAHFLRHIDVFWVMLIGLSLAHTAYILKGRITQTNFVVDHIGVCINYIFNLSLVLVLHPFWLLLLK